MSYPLDFGFTSLVALASFILGKFWSSSAAVFGCRQRSYAEFTRKCISVHELLLVEKEMDLQNFLPTLREAGAEFNLYASPKANELAGKYLGKLGFVVGANDIEDEEVLAVVDEASRLFQQLQDQMRRDALGWTLFGILDRLCANRNKH